MSRNHWIFNSRWQNTEIEEFCDLDNPDYWLLLQGVKKKGFWINLYCFSSWKENSLNTWMVPRCIERFSLNIKRGHCQSISLFLLIFFFKISSIFTWKSILKWFCSDQSTSSWLKIQKKTYYQKDHFLPWSKRSLFAMFLNNENHTKARIDIVSDKIRDS